MFPEASHFNVLLRNLVVSVITSPLRHYNEFSIDHEKNARSYEFLSNSLQWNIPSARDELSLFFKKWKFYNFKNTQWTEFFSIFIFLTDRKYFEIQKMKSACIIVILIATSYTLVEGVKECKKVRGMRRISFFYLKYKIEWENSICNENNFFKFFRRQHPQKWKFVVFWASLKHGKKKFVVFWK